MVPPEVIQTWHVDYISSHGHSEYLTYLPMYIWYEWKYDLMSHRKLREDVTKNKASLAPPDAIHGQAGPDTRDTTGSDKIRKDDGDKVLHGRMTVCSAYYLLL